MFGKLRLKPREIESMTLPEIVLAMDDDIETPRPPSGSVAVGHANVLALIQRLRSMTPRERLEEARQR